MSSSTVTYTSISFDSDLPPWGFHLISDAEPYSPKAAPQSQEQAPPSPDYVPGTEYMEYLAPSNDEIPVEDQPLPADASPIALSPGYVADYDPLEEDLKEDPADEAWKTFRAHTSLSASIEALIVEYASAPTPPLPLLSPLTPLSSPLPQIPSPPLPLPPPPLLFEVGESSTAAVARQTGHTLSRKVDYGFINTLDASIRASEEDIYARQAWSCSKDRSTSLEALIREHEARITSLEAQITTLQTQHGRMEWQRQEAGDMMTRAFGHIHLLEARDLACLDDFEDTGSSC
ncbi:hypothetical protein Tco_0381256 [Tanacetum coccineum]